MNEEEMRVYWDDFAEEYYQIQQESQLPIVEDVVAFLEEKQLLPTTYVVDAGGGAGRYMAALASKAERYELFDLSPEMLRYAELERKKARLENVAVVQRSFNDYFEEKEQQATLVFAALTPFLNSTEQLLRLTARSLEWCVLLRMVKNEDDLFVPFERALGIYEESKEQFEVEQLIEGLSANGYQVSSHQFSYVYTEKITRAFFSEYYEEYAGTAIMEKWLEEHFSPVRDSRTTVDYQLIYWHK